MVTKVWFNNARNKNEQALYESLAIEAIQARGNDIIYLPRTNVSKDSLMEEDTQVAFNGHFFIEAITRNVEGFQGDGHFMSQLGIEIRDQTTYDMSLRRFLSEANKKGFTNLLRPNEGDLIYDQITTKIMEIKFVDKFTTAYQLGALQFYTIKCEQFEYAGQTLNTGIPVIDNLTTTLSQDILPLIVKDANGDPILDANGEIQWLSSDHGNFEPNDDTIEIRKEAREIMDWSEEDPFAESQNF